MVLDGLPSLYGLKYESAPAPWLPLYLCSYKLDGSIMGLAFTEQLEEARTAAGPPTTFMATSGVAELGGEERTFAQWKMEW